MDGGGDDVSSAMMTTAIMEAWTTSSAVLAVRVRCVCVTILMFIDS